jgi:hypothetical protein
LAAALQLATQPPAFEERSNTCVSEAHSDDRGTTSAKGVHHSALKA